MFKRIVFMIIMVILCAFIVLAAREVDQNEAQRTVKLEELNQMILPYQREINEIKDELAANKGNSENKWFIPCVIFGYYAENAQEIREEGVIILDAGADADTVAAAKATGREILYFFNPAVSVPTDGEAVILRAQYDSVENRSKISGVISCFVDNLSAGVLEDGTVNIPYIYNKSDDSSILKRLNNCGEALLVIFDQQVSQNAQVIKDRMQKGYLQGGSVEEVAQMLRGIENTNSDYKSQYDAYVKSREGRIAELEEKIDEIYEQWNEEKKEEVGKDSYGIKQFFSLSRIKEESIVIEEYLKEKTSDFIGQIVQWHNKIIKQIC